MLDWLTSRRKPQDEHVHPLASEEGLRKLLGEIQGRSPKAAVDELTGHYGTLSELGDQVPPQQFMQAAHALHEKAWGYLPALHRELFPAAPAPALPDPQHFSLSSFYRQCASVLHQALDLVSAAPDSDTQRSQIAQLAAKSLHARINLEKLQRFRYRNPEQSLWKHYGELLALVRRHGVQIQPVKLNGQDTRDRSFQSLLLHALALETAPLENLAPEQIECLDRFIDRHEPMLVWQELSEECARFVYDEGLPRPAKADQTYGVDALYFGFGLAYDELEKHIADLRDGAPAEWLEQAPGTLDQKLHVLSLMSDVWSHRPPNRLFPRQQEQGVVKVVHGFEEIRRMITIQENVRDGRPMRMYELHQNRDKMQAMEFGSVAAAPTPASTKSRLEQQEELERANKKDPIDEWQVNDSSSTGLGLLVPLQKPWLQIGALLGVRSPDALDWHLAIVRRLTRTPKGQRLAGLRLIDAEPELASFRRLKPNEQVGQQNAAQEGQRGAILLDRKYGLLMVKAGTTDVATRLALQAKNLHQIIRVCEIVESDDESMIVLYRPEAS